MKVRREPMNLFLFACCILLTALPTVFTKKTILRHGGFEYYANGTKNGIKRYICKNYRNKHCMARLSIDPNGVKITGGTHICGQQGQISGQQGQVMQR